ncbi:MAG TPA: Calx-beta domain-containing protein [Verrucomicrobiae bacterium]|nr:Calx-beta domain-containing protein [Verrucomicrobiae bacterium]
MNIPTQRGALEPGAYTLRERDDGGNVLAFIRTGDNSGAGKLGYDVVPGSALAGEHYVTAPDGEVTFAAGASRASVPITVIDNAIAEADRVLFVRTLNDDGSVQSTTPITIRNEDVGIRLLSREGNVMRIAAFAGEQPRFSLMRSATWLHGSSRRYSQTAFRLT